MSYPTGPSFSTPPPPPVQPGYSPAPPGQVAMILAALSAGIGGLGFLLHCPCVGCFLIWMPPLAIVLGVVALTQQPDQTAKVLAIAGICCGTLSLLIWAAMIAMAVLSAALHPPQPQPFDP